MLHWCSWAGWPKVVVCDRGLHNRGAFAKMLGERGIPITPIALESPEQIGTVERHGALWKHIAKRVIAARQLVAEEDVKLMTCEINSVKNEQSRTGGFAPAQWVLGKYPHAPTGDRFDEDSWADMGILSAKLDPDSVFAKQMEIRISARRAFVREDSGKRVARALLRRSGALPGDYAVGDLISFRIKRRDRGKEQNAIRWSTAARIIGFDGQKVAWVLCEGVPFAVATDKIRPATAAETLAYLHLAKAARQDPIDVNFDTNGPSQMSYVDADDVVVNDPARPEAPDETAFVEEGYTTDQILSSDEAHTIDVEEMPELEIEPEEDEIDAVVPQTKNQN